MGKKVSVVSFARVVEPQTYVKIALGDHILPEDRVMQYINYLGERTAHDALQAIDGSSLILCSGSALNVGIPTNLNSHDLEPNLKEKTVRELVIFFEFLLIQSLLGNPNAEKYLLLANCFSAQALAFAMVLVDSLIEAKANLQAVQTIDDLDKLQPPEQTWAEQKPVFPIVKTRDTQLGLMPTNITAPDHWIFDGMEHDRGLLYVHNQAILLEVLESLQHIKPQILAKRDLAVFQKNAAPVKPIVDMFSFGHARGKPRMIATQPHLDYGKSLDHLMEVLMIAMKNPKFADLFRPGTGGGDENGNPRSIEDVLCELYWKEQDLNGYQAIANCLTETGLAKAA